MSITYSEYVRVALGVQHANEHAPYCHLCPAWLYNIFPTLSHKRHDFRNKVIKLKLLNNNIE
jgi:hypothetical protein